MQIKIKYGSSVIVREVPDDTTIGDIKADDSIRGALGYGDNVNATYLGTTLSDSALVPEFIDTGEIGNPYKGAVVMETACNKKEIGAIVDFICS